MRYRLIPILGTSDPSSFVEVDDEQQLRETAESLSRELDKPVLVVRYPVDQQHIQPLYTVGLKEKKRRVR